MENSNDLYDYQIKERKLIKSGKQKTLFENTVNDKINWDIADKFTPIIKLSKIIEANENEFDAVVDNFTIKPEEFDKVMKVAKEIYGDDCKFYFNTESQWNISFGVLKRKND